MTPAPEYLLAMKCLAMRIGDGSRDADGVRFLLRHQTFTESAAAREAVGRSCPPEKVPQGTLDALEETLTGRGPWNRDSGNGPRNMTYRDAWRGALCWS